MATTSNALVPLGDRDYLMKIVGRNASDKADVLNPLTGLEAKALSDVALVTRTELVGEAWQGGRNYLCKWLVGHFPIFDELAIRIHGRKQKGMSPPIIKGQEGITFKQAIRLILDCDPSYYFKLRKKYLGGGWQKALPGKATAPEKAEVAETSATDIKVGEPDAKHAEVFGPNPVPLPSGETVDKVHSDANETATEINAPESKAVGPAPPISVQPKPKKEKEGKVHPPPPWGKIDGTKVDVVFSAAHKCVRRGNEADAIAWIRLLHLNGFHVWKQLKIYAMEDIGLADTSVLSRIGILEKFADEVKDSAHHPELLAIIEAVMILCRAKKSHATDEAAIWFQENPTYVPPTEDEDQQASEIELVKPPIYEEYLDKHTAEGRHNGRGLEDFKKTENEALANKADVAAFVPPLVDVTDAVKAQIEYLQKRIKSLEKENASLREELEKYAVAAAP